MTIELNIGEGIDLKLGMTTLHIERVTKTKYLLHETSSGWQTAMVNKETLDKLTKGEITKLDLDWL